MMELISAIIFIGSVIGMGLIVYRKIPALASLPEISLTKETKEGLISRIEKKIRQWPSLKNFSYELFLQKILAKIRIIILKIENLTFRWLQKLRESHKKKNASKIDNYWGKIKKEITRIKK